MNKHYGQPVECIIRRNGYSLTALAQHLNVNRRSIYNFFSNENLNKTIIFRIGLIIRYDFSSVFPELFQHGDFDKIYQPKLDIKTIINDQQINIDTWKLKYITLLEKYNELLIHNLPYQN